MGVGSASIGAPPPHRRKTSGQLSWLLLPWNELSYSMGATPEPQHSHRPVSRQRFFDEFSSAVKAINQLNVRQPTWYVDSRTGSSRSPQPTKGMFTGRLKETTQQVSYVTTSTIEPSHIVLVPLHPPVHHKQRLLNAYYTFACALA